MEDAMILVMIKRNMADYTFTVLPYGDIESARLAIPNACHFSCFKLKRDANYSKMEGRILTGFIVGKAMLCIEDKFYEFLQNYHIEYITKVFWDDTSWEINYKSSEYTYKVFSGTRMGGWSTEYETRRDSCANIGRIMISQSKELLRVAEREWPHQRFIELYNRVRNQIATVTVYK